MYKDATILEVNEAMEKAWAAFPVYRNCSRRQRAALMRAIAEEIGALGDELLHTAGEETHLPEARLRNERARTIFQLTSYADACEQGDWLDASIDRAVPGKNPPKPDIRKMMVPLGPVVVFGAANFPFAYSTAGGDTASALAAGCPVIVKAHPAHARTSQLMAEAIQKAVQRCSLPEAVFTHLHGKGNEIGKALVEHPRTMAVGFTGSFAGGKQLYDWACQRPVPIPVFAEMSSVNPVFLLPGKIKEDAAGTAAAYAGSITLGAGQFCTNPGLLIGVDNTDLDKFAESLGAAIQQSAPGMMLHEGIYKNYQAARSAALAQSGVETLAVSSLPAEDGQGAPTLAAVKADTFIKNPQLHREVFGPYSLLIKCKDIAEMLEVTRHLEGQLTATLMATQEDLAQQPGLLEAVKDICGRFIINGVPTGVEVCKSMQHGGPFPATTDSRFGAVGADAIKRFVRPLAFQNWPHDLLPDELKDDNPLQIRRSET